MTPAFKSRRARRTHGITLIELLVSVAIGMVLMIAIISAYLGSAGASRMAEAQGRMNEDAQAALSILAQQIRMAGDNPRRPEYDNATRRNPAFTATTYFIRGCDGTFTDVTTATDIASLTCSAGTNNNPDSIAISYEADVDNTVPTSGGVATDCLGQGLPTVTGNITKWDGVSTVAPATTTVAATFTVADNRFYIATPASSSTPSLYCSGNGRALLASSRQSPQPLAENIEDLQFVYGTAPTTGTMTMAGFLTANEVETEINLAALPDSPSRWARTMTVRICVLARSNDPVVSDTGSAGYYNCQGTLVTNPPDKRLRRAYFSTVVMRNRVPS